MEHRPTSTLLVFLIHSRKGRCIKMAPLERPEIVRSRMAVRFPAVDEHTVSCGKRISHSFIGKAPVPDRTTKQRNDVRFVLVDVCWWIACKEPTSCRCSNDVRANVDGVYRIREEVTEEDCGLNSSWSILLPPFS